MVVDRRKDQKQLARPYFFWLDPHPLFRTFSLPTLGGGEFFRVACISGERSTLYTHTYISVSYSMEASRLQEAGQGRQNKHQSSLSLPPSHPIFFFSVDGKRKRRQNNIQISKRKSSNSTNRAVENC